MSTSDIELLSAWREGHNATAFRELVAKVAVNARVLAQTPTPAEGEQELLHNGQERVVDFRLPADATEGPPSTTK